MPVLGTHFLRVANKSSLAAPGDAVIVKDFLFASKAPSKVLWSTSNISDAETTLIRVRQALRRSMARPAGETFTVVLRRLPPTIRLTPPKIAGIPRMIIRIRKASWPPPEPRFDEQPRTIAGITTRRITAGANTPRTRLSGNLGPGMTIFVSPEDSITLQSIRGGRIGCPVSASPRSRRSRRLSPACSERTTVSWSVVVSDRDRCRKRDRYSACFRASLNCCGDD